MARVVPRGLLVWPSAAIALARLQMNRPKQNGPPVKPSGMNHEHGALWGFLTHLNNRIDGLYTVMITGFLALVGLFVAVLIAVLME